MRRGELHLAVGFQDAALPRREHDGVVRVDLVREPFVVALPPGHPLAAHDAVAARGARRRAVGGAERRQPDRPRVPRGGLQPRLVMISRDPLANRALVTQGLAVTIMPRLLAREFTGVALRPLTATRRSATSTCCCRPAGATRSPTTRAPPCAK